MKDKNHLLREFRTASRKHVDTQRKKYDSLDLKFNMKGGEKWAI